MNQFSQEYIASIVIVLVSLLKAFGFEIGSDVVTAIITGVLAVWVAVRRFQKKDISVLGKKV